MSQAPAGYDLDSAGNLIPRPVTKGGRVGKEKMTGSGGCDAALD